MRAIAAALMLCASLAATAAPGPYDETADAKAQVQTALSQAGRERKPVLLVFGANWCGDCKVLDQSFKEGTTAGLISQSFQVVKIDVGRFDRNTDVAQTYGVPLKKGIPAVAVLSPQGHVMYATQAGELADARKMGDKGIHDFFSKMLPTLR